MKDMVGDLVGVIGGSTNRQISANAKRRHSAGANGIPQTAHHLNFVKHSDAKNMSAGAAARARAGKLERVHASVGKSAKPEDVLPLDEDDFKEF